MKAKKAAKKAVKSTKLSAEKQKFYDILVAKCARALSIKSIALGYAEVQSVRDRLDALKAEYEQTKKTILAQPKEVDDGKKSPKVKKIEKLIKKSDFGCQTKSVAALVSTIIGEKVSVDECESDLLEELEINYGNKIDEIRSSEVGIDLQILPTGTVIVFDEQDDEWGIPEGTYLFHRHVCADDWTGHLESNKGDCYYVEYIEYAITHIATEEEVMKFVKGANKSVLNPDRYLMV